jgi:hypothetical protein
MKQQARHSHRGREKLGDFGTQVPGEHENDVCGFFVEYRGGTDGDPYSWDHASLFVGVGIHGELQLVRSNPTVIEQSGGLSGGPVADQASSAGTDIVDNFAQAVSQPYAAPTESAVDGRVVQTCGTFRKAHLVYRLCRA